MLPVLFSYGPIQIRTFGLMLLLAMFAGTFIMWKRAREEHYDEFEVFDLILITTLWAMVGGRLMYVAFHFQEFGLNILYWLSLWSRPGFHWLGLYGAGLVAFLRFCHQHKWDTFKTLDVVVIGLSLVQALLALGIFISGGGTGTPTNLPIGVTTAGSFESRHPVGLYAALLWFGVFVFLWWVEGRYRRFEWYQKFKGDSRPGFLVSVYFMALGFIGAILSLVSEPEYVYYGINIDLMMRICILLVGALALVSRSGLGSKLGLDEIFVWHKKKK